MSMFFQKGERGMIKNSCFECRFFQWNRCVIYQYYFKDHVAKKTTCERYKERRMIKTEELTKYIGKWIAIVQSEVVCVGNSGKEVFEKVKESYPKQEPFIMKVPKNEATLL